MIVDLLKHVLYLTCAIDVSRTTKHEVPWTMVQYRKKVQNSKNSTT